MGQQDGYVRVSQQLLTPPAFVKVVMARATQISNQLIDVVVTVLLPVAVRSMLVDCYTREVKSEAPAPVDLPRSFVHSENGGWIYVTTVTEYDYLVHDPEELMEMMTVAQLSQHDKLYNRVTVAELTGGWPEHVATERCNQAVIDVKKAAEAAHREKMLNSKGGL